jgi:NAD(P)H dehydrogenase (quinone)
MNILSVYVHHEPTSLTSSLKNLAVSSLMRQGHLVIESDLYASGFSPKAEKFDFTINSTKHFNYMLEQRFASSNGLAFAPDITSELDKISQADLIIFHTPIWWFSVPAVLKGWFDRVLVMGVAWDGGKIYENGLFRGKSAMLCAVAGGPKEYYQENGKHQATMKQILHPIHHGTLAFCGMDVLEPFVVYNALGQTKEGYEQVLKDYQFKIDNLLTSPTYLQKYD